MSKTIPTAIVKICQLNEKNMCFSMYMAFGKIKLASSQQKTDEKILKNVVNLLQRIEKYKLKQAFS